MNTLRVTGVALLALALATRATAAPQATRFIGVLVYDQVLTSDVTAPLEVFGHASTQPEFAAYSEAGLLAGRRATTDPGGELLMKLRYPRTQVVFGDPVVVDGNLVTSNGGLVRYTAAIRLLVATSDATFPQEMAGNLYVNRLVPLDKVLAGVSGPGTGATADPASR